MAGNVIKGWPLGSALDGNARVAPGATIVAGDAVRRNAAGELVLATGAALEVAFHALDRSAASDVIEARSLPFIIGNAICSTDRFVAGTSPAPNQELIVGSGVNAGRLKVRVLPGEATQPTYGYFERFEVIQGVNQLVFIKPVPLGRAT